MFGKKKEEEKTTTEEIKEEVKPEGKDEGETKTEEIKEGEKKVEEEAAAPEEKKEDEKAADEEGKAEDQPDPNEVTETEENQAPNGARIEDLVTKEELAERFSALEAKLDAVLNENASLKDQLAKVKEKYEDNDFGGLQKQGMVEQDKVANDTFESYSKAFMPK